MRRQRKPVHFTAFTYNMTFSRWNEVFVDVIIASAILDRVLHHCSVINIKGESYRLKERKEFMRKMLSSTFQCLFAKAIKSTTDLPLGTNWFIHASHLLSQPRKRVIFSDVPFRKPSKPRKPKMIEILHNF